MIGNGFDLAHGLPTSYREFIADYWDGCSSPLQSMCAYGSRNEFDDDLVHISFRSETHCFPRYEKLEHMQSAADVEAYMQQFDEKAVLKYKSPFFEAINRTVESKKWVDIENIYYLFLKKIFKERGTSAYRCPEDLDAEFELIRKRLSDYLSKIQNERICEELLMEEISRRIFEPFGIRDISCQGWCDFEQSLLAKFENWEANVYSYSVNFNAENEKVYRSVDKYIKSLTLQQGFSAMVGAPNVDETRHIENIRKHLQLVPKYFYVPDQILLLNFNYTKTADLYLPEESDFKTIHIHGELDNKENPMIFGYGDELDDDYKAISKLDDNAYLKNIKSIRYLETDNYRRLLTFIDSAPFQIYIMGHSCGNSDRTLLNTLFEHRNCVSIKPFYHKREDGTDDYIEIVQNISRNFNDMQMMRDRVVNKRYCHPLAQRPKP